METTKLQGGRQQQQLQRCPDGAQTWFRSRVTALQLRNRHCLPPPRPRLLRSASTQSRGLRPTAPQPPRQQ